MHWSMDFIDNLDPLGVKVRQGLSQLQYVLMGIIKCQIVEDFVYSYLGLKVEQSNSSCISRE